MAIKPNSLVLSTLLVVAGLLLTVDTARAGVIVIDSIATPTEASASALVSTVIQTFDFDTNEIVFTPVTLQDFSGAIVGPPNPSTAIAATVLDPFVFTTAIATAASEASTLIPTTVGGGDAIVATSVTSGLAGAETTVNDIFIDPGIGLAQADAQSAYELLFEIQDWSYDYQITGELLSAFAGGLGGATLELTSLSSSSLVFGASALDGTNTSVNQTGILAPDLYRLTIAAAASSAVNFDSNIPANNLFGGEGFGGWQIDFLSLTPHHDVLAVPEPSTFSLLGAGLLGLGFIKRKRAA